MLFKPDIYHDLFQIHRLEHHKDHRKKNDLQSWKFHQKFVVDRIKTLRSQIEISLGKKFRGEQERILDDLDVTIHKSICRLRTNTLQLNTEDSKLRSAMGLYPIYSLLNHSCLANTTTKKFPSRQGFKYVSFLQILSIFLHSGFMQMFEKQILLFHTPTSTQDKAWELPRKLFYVHINFVDGKSVNL